MYRSVGSVGQSAILSVIGMTEPGEKLEVGNDGQMMCVQLLSLNLGEGA